MKSFQFLLNPNQISRLDGGIGGGKATKQKDHLAAQAEDRGIVIRDLRKEYRLSRGRARVALKGLNVTFGEGSITALLGHNGAGKSTTIGMITGMLEPTRGSVTINGMDTVEDWREVKQMLGYCPQHSILYDSLTVIEHLQLYSTLKGGDAEEVG